MKVLVTGATGYLGSRLCEFLAQHGHLVTATGRNARKAEPLTQKGIHFVACDLVDANSLPLAGHDAVVHCAARSSVWGHPQAFFRDNVLATDRLAAESKAAGVRQFLHISTPSIFADLRDRHHLAEDAAPAQHPLNPYAATKLEAEKRLVSHSGNGFQVSILRPQAIVGPGEQAILPRFLKVNERSGIPVIRGGRAETDLVPVENVLEIIQLLLATPSNEHLRCYHVSNGNPQRLLHLLERMLSAIHIPMRTRRLPYSMLLGFTSLQETWLTRTHSTREPALTRYGLSVLAFSRTLDIRHAQQELGYTPRVSIDACLESMARWWRDNT